MKTLKVANFFVALIGMTGMISCSTVRNANETNIQESKRTIARALDAGAAEAGLRATFVLIPRGTFNMGSPDTEPSRHNDETLHNVTISRDFEMAVADVTQLQWFLVMGNNPSYFKTRQYCPDKYTNMSGTGLCPNNPVEQVTWNDAQSFIQKLNAKNDGYIYRLPTEAEWEYSARAGSQTAYFFGDDALWLGDYAWFYHNSISQTRPVGSRPPNAFGLYDMHGNVSQWVQDGYDNYPTNSVIDPVGLSTEAHATRGGSWSDVAGFCRSATRLHAGALARRNTLGFRLVRTR